MLARNGGKQRKKRLRSCVATASKRLGNGDRCAVLRGPRPEASPLVPDLPVLLDGAALGGVRAQQAEVLHRQPGGANHGLQMRIHDLH